jgi:hypothetical protein
MARRQGVLLRHLKTVAGFDDPVLFDDSRVQEFIRDGVSVLTPQELGVSRSVHKHLYEEGLAFQAESDEGQFKISENSNSRCPALKQGNIVTLHLPCRVSQPMFFAACSVEVAGG